MISLRQATLEDVPRIRSLAETIWRDVYLELIGPEQIEYMLGWMYSAEKLQGEIGSGEVKFWMIQFDAVVIGFASMGKESGESEWHLHKFYMSASRHGRGLGSQALQLLIQEAAAIGARVLSLRVNRGNERAIRCYERNGFVREREVCDDIGGGFVMDDYWMSRKIDP